MFSSRKSASWVFVHSPAAEDAEDAEDVEDVEDAEDALLPLLLLLLDPASSCGVKSARHTPLGAPSSRIVVQFFFLHSFDSRLFQLRCVLHVLVHKYSLESNSGGGER